MLALQAYFYFLTNFNFYKYIKQTHKKKDLIIYMDEKMQYHNNIIYVKE
jgi:hypothetical protein